MISLKILAPLIIFGAFIGNAVVAWNDMPPCLYEDGNPDGYECLWTDPDTGSTYYVDSANYR
ncbi:hypothetical protein KIV65_gp12 [Mycobacterium phage Anthony]|uniref:Uncharacterized protein n=1 Tax=Mycobacterium phage Anthony TaxID=2599857 RepID=A0A5J6TIA9_9CAUD|nr:hypothetical protein KIV65_gp12 [Mycobacterium phage Anthony]QFG10455.1 hypothetical protein PBI_ANTHONY_85 [Mycobacterium phage Anthony]